MDATTMHSTVSLLADIQVDFPLFTFSESDCFRWSPDTQTLHFDRNSPDLVPYVLHELGHALLSHTAYHRDIDLIKIERDAWDYAREHLASKYNITISDELVQENLDTYREWLHSRSSCPSCSMTGLQTARGHYSCFACGGRWKSNEARSCALRRYTLPRPQ